MQQYDRLIEVPEQVRPALADWLLALADNKRVLGLRYAEWCTGAPELEADVTLSAMAQYELGHARLLRGVLGDLPEDPRDDSRATDPAAWRCLPVLDRPAAGWPEVLVLNTLVDSLLTLNMATAAAGGVRPLAQRLRKAVSEEQYHALHAQAWMRRLGEAPDEIVERLRAGLWEVLPQCVAWFGPPHPDNALDRLAAAGVIDGGAAGLCQRFVEQVGHLVRPVMEMPAAVGDEEQGPIPVDWAGWNESTRRRGTPEFDEESFAMITGAHARAMGVSD